MTPAHCTAKFLIALLAATAAWGCTTRPDATNEQTAQGGQAGAQGGTSQGGQSPSEGGFAGNSSGSGNQSGASGVGGTTGEDLTALCTEACKTVLTCDGALDVPVCESQCLLEVTGVGFLCKEIALDLFKTLRDVQQDPVCSYTDGSGYWKKWDYSAKPKDKFEKLQEPAVLKECVDAQKTCNIWPKIDEYNYTLDCFNKFYIFGEEQRKKVREVCFTMKCPNPVSCPTYLAYWNTWIGGHKKKSQ